MNCKLETPLRIVKNVAIMATEICCYYMVLNDLFVGESNWVRGVEEVKPQPERIKEEGVGQDWAWKGTNILIFIFSNRAFMQYKYLKIP